MFDSLTFLDDPASLGLPLPSILIPDERAIKSEYAETSDCIDCTIHNVPKSLKSLENERKGYTSMTSIEVMRIAG